MPAMFTHSGDTLDDLTKIPSRQRALGADLAGVYPGQVCPGHTPAKSTVELSPLINPSQQDHMPKH